MALSVALSSEAERAVERERRLVSREDVEFELADTRRARPADRDIEERRPHALAPMTGGDHETQVGHVSTRRVWISGQ